MELANGGTLFLDEIGEMSPMLQVKLLRVLERRTFKRVGGTKDITVNLRIISATNQDLEQHGAGGALPRGPLLPPQGGAALRAAAARAQGRHPAARRGCSWTASRASSRSRSRTISPAAERMLCDYPWPGNIRELRNLFERTVLLESGRDARAPAPEARAARAAQRRATIGQRVDGYAQRCDRGRRRFRSKR